jgi:hypothetical protein
VLSVDFDKVADELYALAPEAFTAARNERSRQSRATGDSELAAQIARLARPTAAGWLANQVVRAYPDEVRALVELGDRLRAATESGDGAALRELAPAQRQIVAALVGRARDVARAHQRAVSEAVSGELENTFRAALADSAAAGQLVQGRLQGALVPGGFTGPAPGARPRPQRAKKPRPTQRIDAAAEQRRAAREAEAAARAALESAGERLTRAEEEQRAAVGEASTAADTVTRLTSELADARAIKARADAAARRAEAAVASARREATAAERRLAAASSVRAQAEDS